MSDDITRMAGFNTQPPEGGCSNITDDSTGVTVSTHSRPKAAASASSSVAVSRNVSTHSRPKAAAVAEMHGKQIDEFQHTAAQRRLLAPVEDFFHFIDSFNTQPPEGGCLGSFHAVIFRGRFNTQPPEGGCPLKLFLPEQRLGFNTQPPEGGCKKTMTI